MIWIFQKWFQILLILMMLDIHTKLKLFFCFVFCFWKMNVKCLSSILFFLKKCRKKERRRKKTQSNQFGFRWIFFFSLNNSFTVINVDILKFHFILWKTLLQLFRGTFCLFVCFFPRPISSYNNKIIKNEKK